jgi:hypothetical protein
MTITPEQIVARYPVFAGIPEESIQEFIDDAMDIVNEAVWGSVYPRALKCYTAHLLAVNFQHQLELGTALKTIESATQLQAKFAHNSAIDWLEQTVYGREYLHLLKAAIGSIGVDII